MPKVRVPASLLQLSLQRILDHIIDCDYLFSVQPLQISQISSSSGLWEVHQERFPASSNAVAAGSKLDFNLFHQLPSSLLELIICNVSFFSLKKRKENKTLQFFLQYMISPQIRFLTISYYPEENYFNSNTLFPQLRKLLSLNLSQTTVGDNSLEFIGSYCEKLRILDIGYCQNITDTGIQLLCFKNDGIGAENRRPSDLCKTLQHLRIFSTSITEQGVKMAVCNLITVKCFAHEKIFDVILELTKTRLDKNIADIQSFPFVRLSIDTISPYKRGSLGQVIQFCPSLTSVNLKSINGLTDTDLLSLMSLKYLIRFFLSHEHINLPVKERNLTFKGGVAPLLKKFGHSLEVLYVSICHRITVDIWTIFKDCPCLTYLCVTIHCDRVAALPAESESTLCRNEKERFKLKSLDVLYCYNNSTNTGCNVVGTSSQRSSKILHFLLSFTSLEEIRLSHCDVFTDEFLLNAAKCLNFLKNLNNLILLCCNLVTKTGIDALMTPHNCIQYISIEFCQNLTLANVEEWHLQANRKNWKLRIRFINSNFFESFPSNPMSVIGFE